MDDNRFFRCPQSKTDSFVEAPSAESARVALHCKACTLDRLGSCLGPIEADMPGAPSPTAAPKRRGRPKKDKKERSNAKTVPVSDAPADPRVMVEDCRKALRTLAEPRTKDYSGIIAPFREEIKAARAAGRGWALIAKTLRQFGYPISTLPLKKAMSE